MHQLVIALFLLSCLPVAAERFSINIKSSDLIKLAALEIKLELEPKDAFVLDEDIELNSQNSLYKVVDAEHSLIRIFFLKPIEEEVLIEGLQISGRLLKHNRDSEEQAKFSIAKVKYMPNFALDLDEKSFVSSFKIEKEPEEALPFYGISKVDLIGPRERIFNPNLFIALTNIETYGFAFDQSIKNISINGFKAKFITADVIAANIELEQIPEGRELPLVLELELNKQFVKKKVGDISFLESL